MNREASDAHRCLKELIQAVRSLYQLESDRGHEKLLQLLNRETTGVEPDDDNRDKATTSYDDVEEIPSVCAVAAPSQTIQTNEDIDEINDSDAQEEVGCLERQKPGCRWYDGRTHCEDRQRNVEGRRFGSYETVRMWRTA